MEKKSTSYFLAIFFMLVLPGSLMAAGAGDLSASLDWNSITLICVVVLLLIAAYFLIRKHNSKKAKIKAKRKKKL